jgi:putative RNA 2'-phosphotransferase
MAPSRLVRTSRFLSRVIRHAPDTAGVQLDPEGRVDVDTLVEGARRHGAPITREIVLDVVARNDKQRFALDASGRRIRANQGHFVPVDLALVARPPPAVLHHGTATRYVQSIRREGLRPQGRQHVHLSDAPGIAWQVGARHGVPVVLDVDAARLHALGHAFYLSANGVWLTDRVPPAFLRFPSRASRAASG